MFLMKEWIRELPKDPLRLVGLLIACLLLALLLIRPAQAAEITASGQCGDDLTWTLDGDGVLTISGTGDMDDYYGSTPWDRGAVKKVVIENGVTGIGVSAFWNCANLTSATIPDSIVRIGSAAFFGCSSLTGSLTIPSGVTYIDMNTFYGCRSLNGTLTLPDGLETIGEGAFYNCANLSGILRIPDSVKTIGDRAFCDCRSFTGLTLSENLTTIGEYAFDTCWNLCGTLVIPERVASIGYGAFDCCFDLANIIFEGNAIASTDENGNIIYPFYTQNDITLYVPKGNDTWTVPEWNGYKTVWYTPPGTVTLGAAGSEIYIPTGETGEYDANTIGRTKINFWAGIAPEGYQEVPMEIPWGWNLFRQDTGVYDNRLAIASLAMSSAVERSSEELGKLLKDLGFQGYHHKEYDLMTSGYVTHAVARKQVEFDGEDCDIFAVVCRGTGNFGDVLTDVALTGFTDAADLVWDTLQEYLLDYYGEAELSALKDKNMKFLITGHSLGGAAANLLSEELGTLVPNEDVFVYTFASPRTWSNSWTGKTNVHNIINAEDIVPSLPPYMGYRIGNDYVFHRKYVNRLNTAFMLLTNGGINGYGLDYLMEAKPSDLQQILTGTYLFHYNAKLGYAHSATTYMAYLLAGDPRTDLYTYKIRKASICCPVDVEVYNNDGDLVGRVKDNKIDETIPVDVFFLIDGDDKFVYLPFDDEYTFVLTGNDTGTMSYTVEETDPATGTNTKKEFSAVALTDGKIMTSEAGGQIPANQVQLFVVDNGSPTAEVGASGTETAVGEQIPVITITGVPSQIVRGSALTLIGTVHPSYASRKDVAWSLTDAGTTGAALTANVLTTAASGTVTLTATVADGVAQGTDFTQTFSIKVVEPPALSAPSLLEWDGRTAAWNFVTNAAGYCVQLYKDGDAVGDPITTAALSYDFTAQMTEEGEGTYTFQVKAIGDHMAYSDSLLSEPSPVWRPNEVAFTSVSDGIAEMRIRLDEGIDTATVMAARYGEGRMTALYTCVVTDSGIVTADLSAGSGTVYKAFLLNAERIPLCPAGTY